MVGPGAYRPDPTEGMTAIADLPPPEIVPYSRNDKRQPCPRCGHAAYWDKQPHRALHDLGNLDLWCPRDLVVTYLQHYCTKCQKYFNADLSDLAPPGSQYGPLPSTYPSVISSSFETANIPRIWLRSGV